MIQNEATLHQTIEQLERLYQAMRHQYNDIYAKNPEKFRLFTEGTIDHIRRLLKELDDDCGVTAALAIEDPDQAEDKLAPSETFRKTG
jgi:hypothetical protein